MSSKSDIRPFEWRSWHGNTEQTLNEEIEQGTVMMKMVSMTIGREPPAQFILDFPFVSRRHCEIRLSPQGLLIRDLNSSNGTFINNSPISDWTPLKQKDELALGSFNVPNSIRERWFIQLSSSQDRDRIHRFEGDPRQWCVDHRTCRPHPIDHPTVCTACRATHDGNLSIKDLGSGMAPPTVCPSQVRFTRTSISDK